MADLIQGLGFEGITPKVVETPGTDASPDKVDVLKAFTPIKGAQVGEREGEPGAIFRNVGWEFNPKTINEFAQLIPVLGFLDITVDYTTTYDSFGSPIYYDNHTFKPKGDIPEGVEYEIYDDSSVSRLKKIGIIKKMDLDDPQKEMKTGEQFVIAVRAGGHEGYYQISSHRTDNVIRVISADDFKQKLTKETEVLV